MEPINVFRTYLGKLVSIPPLEWVFIARHLRLRKLVKDQFYYQQGQDFDEIGFVVKGLLYNFYTKTDGQVHVKNFISEGEPVTCYSNLIAGTPASFSCKTLEDTILVTLNYKVLLQMYDRHTCWERMGRVSAEKLFALKEQRELNFLSMDTRDHYLSFVEECPQLANRIPLYLIASYLGVSAVSLSRIRSELKK